jgi:hypothetical protein
MSVGYSPGDFELPLRRIEASGLDYFVEGGQAVNIWAEVYAATAPGVADLAPFTSKDCDLWVGYELFEQIERILPGGKLTKASDPSQGQLGIFTTDDEPPKVIDLFDGVFGLTREELRRARERSLLVNGIRLIDPLFLFKAKCHNLAKLPDQQGRNDAKHLSILLRMLPAHLETLLEEALRHEAETSDRKLLNEIKLLYSFRRDKWVRQALDQLSTFLDAVLPVERFRTCGLPKTEAFVHSDLKW